MGCSCATSALAQQPAEVLAVPGGQAAPAWEVELETGWQRYSDGTAKLLDRAAARRCEKVDFEAGGRRYELDLCSMMQVDRDSGQRHAVRRCAPDAGLSKFDIYLPSEAPLTAYFTHGYLDGELYSGPKYSLAFDRDLQQQVLEHTATGIRVWSEALDASEEAPGDTVVVLYLYTGRTGFESITRDGVLDAGLFARLEDGSLRGVCTSSKEPEAFGSKSAVLINNHLLSIVGQHNDACSAGPEGPQGGKLTDAETTEGEQAKESVDFCVPILTPQRLAYDVSKQFAPEAGQQAQAEPGRSLWKTAKRDVWLLRLPEDGGLWPTKRSSEARLERCRKRAQRLEARLGPGHPDTLAARALVAALLIRTGDYGEAEICLRRQLSALEKALGHSHPDTSTAAASLAEVLQADGQLEEAVALHRRALKAREETSGAGHPATVVSINSLATLLQSMGELGEAEELYRRGLSLQEEVRGAAHPETLLFAGNLATLLIAAERYSEAEPLCHRALQGRLEALGPSHPDTLTASNELALLLQGLGRHAEAEARFRQALAVQEETLGSEHPDTLISVNNLAHLLQAVGRPGDAEPLRRRILQASEASLGPEHPDTLACCCDLGLLLWGMGRDAEAEPLLRSCLQEPGPPREQARRARRALAQLLQRTGRRGEARRLRHRKSKGHRPGLVQV